MNTAATSLNSRLLLYRLTPLAALASSACLALPGNLQAQVLVSGTMLPLALAHEAAQEAVRSCEASG